MIDTCGSKMPPAALATPSVSSTSASRSALKGGSCPSSDSIASCEVTTASMPAFDSVKMSLNDRSIVSVSTYVPATIITPSTIASE